MKTTDTNAAGQAAHTPGPFTAHDAIPIGGYWRADVRNDKGERLCAVLKRDHLPKTTANANAAFIVTACNAHAGLVALLEEFAAEDSQCRTDWLSLKKRARAALADAKGGSHE